MFENLTGRLSDAARSLSGKGRITETNIKDTLRHQSTHLHVAASEVADSRRPALEFLAGRFCALLREYSGSTAALTDSVLESPRPRASDVHSLPGKIPLRLQ